MMLCAITKRMIFFWMTSAMASVGLRALRLPSLLQRALQAMLSIRSCRSGGSREACGNEAIASFAITMFTFFFSGKIFAISGKRSQQRRRLPRPCLAAVAVGVCIAAHRVQHVR